MLMLIWLIVAVLYIIENIISTTALNVWKLENESSAMKNSIAE